MDAERGPRRAMPSGRLCRYARSHALAAVAAGCVLLAGCEPFALPSADPPPTTASALPSASGGRLIGGALTAPIGDPVGQVDVTSDGASVKVSVSISHAEPFMPWGIYAQAECAMPDADQDAPYQFADIEDGARTEALEAAPYLAYPGPLTLLVFRDGGAAVEGCLQLGLPEAVATDAPTTCAPGPASPASAATSAAPALAIGELAFSNEVLSNADIYLRGTDGSTTRLTDALGVDTKPSWSPDGARIAFRTSRDGQDEIYVMRADGTCQTNITGTPVDDRSPAWSPSGCLIAFDHFFNRQLQDIAVIDPRGGPIRRVTTLSGEYPSWSPDGRRLAFASARGGDYDLYTINLDGSDEQVLLHAPGYQMYPTWSPDGRWIAYESGADPIDGLEIHVMHPDGSGDHVVSAPSGTNRFPAWSGDGHLAWSASGTIVVSDARGITPTEVATGQFPAFRDWATHATPAC